MIIAKIKAHLKNLYITLKKLLIWVKIGFKEGCYE